MTARSSSSPIAKALSGFVIGLFAYSLPSNFAESRLVSKNFGEICDYVGSKSNDEIKDLWTEALMVDQDGKLLNNYFYSPTPFVDKPIPVYFSKKMKKYSSAFRNFYKDFRSKTIIVNDIKDAYISILSIDDFEKSSHHIINVNDKCFVALIIEKEYRYDKKFESMVQEKFANAEMLEYIFINRKASLVFNSKFTNEYEIDYCLVRGSMALSGYTSGKKIIDEINRYGYNVLEYTPIDRLLRERVRPNISGFLFRKSYLEYSIEEIRDICMNVTYMNERN